MNLLKEIQARKATNRKSLAILVDPDKIEDISSLNSLVALSKECYVDFFFVGGSLLTVDNLGNVINRLKESCDIPVIIFPGNNMQINSSADGILFLSLISGRNPDFLIGQHVNAAPLLKKSKLEVISTGYMLINAESTSAVSYMSNTMPIPPDKYSIASSTALAGEMLGMQLIYMDAGSGAKNCITPKMIRKVSENISLPLIIGGGISSAKLAGEALEAGADVIVIGNAIEKNPDLMIEVSEKIYDFNKTLNIH